MELSVPVMFQPTFSPFQAIQVWALQYAARVNHVGSGSPVAIVVGLCFGFVVFGYILVDVFGLAAYGLMVWPNGSPPAMDRVRLVRTADGDVKILFHACPGKAASRGGIVSSRGCLDGRRIQLERRFLLLDSGFRGRVVSSGGRGCLGNGLCSEIR